MWFILTGKKTEYYKVTYDDGEFFIAKKIRTRWINVFSTVDKTFKRLQQGNYLYGSPMNYGRTREKISEIEAQIEIMLG